MKKPYVVFDVDGILATDKKPINPSVIRALERFKSNGGRMSIITGAPLHHVPNELSSLSDFVFAEHGAVQWRQGEMIVLGGSAAIARIKEVLGVVVEDGLQEIGGKTVIVEGPRQASLTLLVGSPPHYPFGEMKANLNELMMRLVEIISKGSFNVNVAPGRDGAYSWIDLTVTTKSRTIEQALGAGVLPASIFYAGDKRNDLEVMRLDGVVPVGFCNCLPEIIAFARQKDLFFDSLPYEGGIAEFLDRIG